MSQAHAENEGEEGGEGKEGRTKRKGGGKGGKGDMREAGAVACSGTWQRGRGACERHSWRLRYKRDGSRSTWASCPEMGSMRPLPPLLPRLNPLPSIALACQLHCPHNDACQNACTIVETFV